jgi:hypothetical protein
VAISRLPFGQIADEGDTVYIDIWKSLLGVLVSGELYEAVREAFDPQTISRGPSAFTYTCSIACGRNTMTHSIHSFAGDPMCLNAGHSKSLVPVAPLHRNPPLQCRLGCSSGGRQVKPGEGVDTHRAQLSKGQRVFWPWLLAAASPRPAPRSLALTFNGIEPRSEICANRRRKLTDTHDTSPSIRNIIFWGRTPKEGSAATRLASPVTALPQVPRLHLPGCSCLARI